MAKKFAMNWDAIQEKVKESEKKTFEKDSRLYIPQKNKDGSFKALIRFLPQKDLNKVPYVELYSHNFSVKEKWYINDCPTTIKGSKCPVCESNKELWDTDEDTVRLRSRKLRVYSNILVLKDPQCPENEGKVFIYGYGVKIFNKIKAAMFPTEESGEDPIRVFDFYEGVNFKLNIKNIKVGKKFQPNYDDSAFSDTITEVADGDDEAIEQIHNQCYDLSEFNDPKRFKTYGELLERFNQVTNGKSSSNDTEETTDDTKEETVETEVESETIEDPVEEEVKEEPKKVETNKDAFLAKLRKNTPKK